MQQTKCYFLINQDVDKYFVVTLNVFLNLKAVIARISKSRTLNQWRTQEFCSEGGSTNSAEDRETERTGIWGGSPLVRGSGGSCNLIQEISFPIVKFS